MALQYLEAFKALGQSPSTKYLSHSSSPSWPTRSAGTSTARTPLDQVRRHPLQGRRAA